MVASLMGLSACGGGSSGGGAATATIKGQAVDKVLSNATVSLYSSGLTGTPLGTATTDASGNYQLTFTPPSGSTPLFLVTASNGNYLGSYIGGANQYSGTTSSSTSPNLNITQVTTAALAIAQNQGVSLSSMTPTNYGQQFKNLQNSIVQLAAVVQGVVDNGCTISGGIGPGNLSTLLGTLTGATNVITSLVGDLSSCSTTTNASTLNTFASQIPANQTIAPQLTSTSATNSTTTSVSSGTYTGTVTPVMTFNTNCSGEGPTAGFSASVTVTVGSNGSIKLSVPSGPSMTGTLSGNNFTMSGTDSDGASISASGALVPLSSVSGGSGFSINGGWQENCTTGSGNFGGTYNIPTLLTSGAALSSTPSSVSNGTYTVTVYPNCTSGNCGTKTSIPATVTINGSTISFSAGSNGSGSGTLSGNTFAMTITSFPGSSCTNQKISVTGVISSSGSGSLSVNGSFQQTSTNCSSSAGTYTMST